MKNYQFLLIVMCLIPSFLLADEVDNGLPSDTSSIVKESARMAINAGIDNQGVIKMTRLMVENKYKEQQMLEVHQILMNANQQNLPESPIINRFYECISKKEKAENSIMALETVRSRYETASEYAGMITRDRVETRMMTELIVQCMTAGMGDIDLKQITELLEKRTKNMKTEEARALNNGTLNTVRTMARSGADSGSVTDLVSNAFQMDYTAKDMEKLGIAFLKQCKDKSSASALAESYANSIIGGATADNIANPEY